MLGGDDAENLSVARAWCVARGAGWTVIDQAGRGGTAPVYGVDSPEGEKALKIYDAAFSRGEKGEVEDRRIEQQRRLGRHGFSGLIEVHDGGRFQDRIFLLMNRASGRELEKRLEDVPREQIRLILDQVARSVIFLRGLGLSHRDIKSANIFITDDFQTATLLDLSVMREINDPVGVGTDQGDRLPVVATARYSPPEYLFRLLKPSAAAWHALDVYQLGGLLHDLIMRVPLFEQAFQSAKDNRYRFAYTVATVQPTVDASDVDRDLLALARRALDKDWRRRSSLNLEDFLSDAVVRQRHALGLLGFGAQAPVASVLSSGEIRAKLNALAGKVREEIIEHLHEKHVLATHEVVWLDDDTCEVRFKWNTERAHGEEVHLLVQLRHDLAAQMSNALSSVVLKFQDKVQGIDLPPTGWDDGLSRTITGFVVQALGELAARLMSTDHTGS